LQLYQLVWYVCDCADVGLIVSTKQLKETKPIWQAKLIYRVDCWYTFRHWASLPTGSWATLKQRWVTHCDCPLVTGRVDGPLYLRYVSCVVFTFP